MQYDIRPTVQRLTHVPFEQLRLVTNISELNLSNINAGIIFVFAGWSGPSVIAFSGVTKILSTLNLTSLDFVIIDNDSMTGEDMIQLFGHVFSGAGETLWIKSGQIFTEIPVFHKTRESQYLDNTNRLLASLA